MQISVRLWMSPSGDSVVVDLGGEPRTLDVVEALELRDHLTSALAKAGIRTFEKSRLPGPAVRLFYKKDMAGAVGDETMRVSYDSTTVNMDKRDRAALLDACRKKL